MRGRDLRKMLWADTPLTTDSVKPEKASACAAVPGSADTQPFELIYAQHIGFVWRCLRVLGVPAALIDDAAQEVFLTVHRRLPEFRGDSGVRTWIYGIVRNVAANQRRSQRRRGPHQALPQELQCAGASPLERAQLGEAAVFIQRFLAGVSEVKRDVFVLAVLEQMSMPEVAQALAVPLDRAYARLRQVRLDFKRALQGERGEP